VDINLTTPALLFPAISLAISIYEIQISVRALELNLSDMERADDGRDIR
jgi:hypothetical protein